MPVTRNSEHPRLGNKLLFVWGLLIFSIWGIYELAKVILVMVTGFALILFWLSVALLCIIGTVAGFNYLFTFVPHLPTSWKFAIAILLCATVIAIGLFVRRYFWRLSKIERSDLLAADWTSTWISFRQKRIICYATHSAKYLYLLTANPLLALKLAGVPAIYKNVHVGIKIDVSHPSIGNSPPTYILHDKWECFCAFLSYFRKLLFCSIYQGFAILVMGQCQYRTHQVLAVLVV